MRRTSLQGFFLILAVFLLTLMALAAEPAPKVENSLPQQNLARYSDSFDKLREDLWGKVGYMVRADSRAANFQLADVRVEGGRVKVETRTGCYSSGGLGPKLRFRGDFDIQVDCRVEFLQGVQDMDQDVTLYGGNRTADMKDEEVESIFIGIMKPGKNPAFIYCGYLEKGRSHPTQGNKFPDRFEGTLRIVRVGENVTMLYRTSGQAEWEKAGSFTRPRYETFIGFKASNFSARRTMIGAKAPLVAFFDEFRINAAHEILEPTGIQDMALLKIENSLPPEKLARFDDTFDTFREDRWETAGFIPKAEIRTNFKQADVRAEGGRLHIITKTGAFSRSGLGSKFYFTGDFDVQVDAQAEFLEDVQDMDQVMSFNAFDKSKELEDEKLEYVTIAAIKAAGKPAVLGSGSQEKGKWTGTGRIEIDRFRGTFRIIRIGKTFTTLYRNQGEEEWRRLSTVLRTPNDIIINFITQNFTGPRTSIGASRSFTASFDNFKINAAQKIVESEI
ncbi:MAG: hypothetical protein AB1512_29775 [Thermodesulfobacteriota bacterium]